MRIFEFNDYRSFLLARVQSMPKRGRGELQKIAHALSIHTTSLSQVLNGQREFTVEQGQALAEHLGLSELETDYMLALIHRARAGSHALRKTMDRQLERIKQQASQMVHRLPRDQILSEENKAVFYSAWYYSAIRLCCSLPQNGTIETIAETLGLQRSLVSRVLAFLVATGLCVEDNGQFRMGPRRTHLEAHSPLVARHHTNWRLKAIERLDRVGPHRELVFTAPMSISRSDAEKLREKLAQTAEQVVATAAQSDPEELYCFNMDWVKFR